MSKKALNKEYLYTKFCKKLEQKARDAVNCEVCFEGEALQRPDCVERPDYVKYAQPRYIGKNYCVAQHRIAFVMINPGVGDEKEEKWQDLLVQFKPKNSKVSLEDVFEKQRKYLKEDWADGGIEKFIELNGLNVEDIALVNIAWCAAQREERPKNKPPSWKNAHPPWMLRKCFELHTSEWLKELGPDVVILSGLSDVAPFKEAICSLLQLPSDNVIPTYHYTHWWRHRKAVDNAEDEAKKVKRKVKALRKANQATA